MVRKRWRSARLAVLLAAFSLSACSGANTAGEDGEVRMELSGNTIERPVYLPKDLPIPAGASVTLSDGKLENGKKSSMLIYETQESMNRLGTTYKEYVKDKSLEQDTQIIDPHNMIINGKVDNAYSYSIIGSSLDSKPGTSEVIVTWLEN
ncbi:hypothetical protein J7E73_15980 [Paenibacillus albidus]|uniref:hypothetical protein n=1 Tax=Paenibacillus albidus TaxID=2041023 RepID=UPI001BEBD8D2|nr:hypothetical protein [Paenibacillus albidus]MBT2290600.1 hypothetical protein [Paenibacillus albidus]